MAIVQISKIQHRRGLIENLPQLASGEIGWAIDVQKLYIGNGTSVEGAPVLGNTEILTEHSNILEIGNSYKFQEIYPGLTAFDTVSRTLQEKLDDVINAKDFGCMGDGLTDDTEAVNQLLFRVYCQWANQQVRRTVYFPAGTYLIDNASIKIPAWAKLIGDGIGSTVFKRVDAGLVFELADSQQYIGGSIGINGGTRPKNIDIVGMTFESTDGDVGYLSQCQSIYFSRVRFQGGLSQPTSSSSDDYGIFIESTPTQISQQILFDSCEWDGVKNGVVINDDVYNVVISNGYFSNLYKGVKLGETTTGTGAALYGPRGTKITNCIFDLIGAHAIHVYKKAQHTVSAFNYFRDVGNNYLGSGNAATPVIEFASGGGSSGNVGGHTSIGDNFERNDADDLVQARITTSNHSAFGLVPGSDSGIMQFGSARQRSGAQKTLNNNVSTATTTGLVLTKTAYPVGAIVEYSIERGTSNNIARRVGVARIAYGTQSTDLASVTDDYAETTNTSGYNTGITLIFENSSTGVEVKYKSSNNVTMGTATMRYQVRYLF